MAPSAGRMLLLLLCARGRGRPAGTAVRGRGRGSCIGSREQRANAVNTQLLCSNPATRMGEGGRAVAAPRAQTTCAAVRKNLRSFLRKKYHGLDLEKVSQLFLRICDSISGNSQPL